MRRICIFCCLLLAAASACGDDKETTTEVTVTEAAPPPTSAEPTASSDEPDAASTASDGATTTVAPAGSEASPATTEPTVTAGAPTTDEDPLDETEPVSPDLVSADELEALAPRAEEMPPGFTLNDDLSGLLSYDDFAAGEEDDYLAIVSDAGWVGSYRTSYAQGENEAVEISTTALRDEGGTKAVFEGLVEGFEKRVGLGTTGEAVELANVGDEARGYVFATTADDSRFGGWVVLWRQGNVLGAVFVGSILPEGEPPREEYRPYAAGLANVTAQRIAETLAG